MILFLVRDVRRQFRGLRGAAVAAAAVWTAAPWPPPPRAMAATDFFGGSNGIFPSNFAKFRQLIIFRNFANSLYYVEFREFLIKILGNCFEKQQISTKFQ